MEDLCFAPIAELAPLIREGAVSPLDLTGAFLDRIARLDPGLNSYLRVLPERALEAAARTDAEVRNGAWRGPLHGVPLGLKDLFDVAGTPTSAQSRLYEHTVAAEDAPVVARLDHAGAVVLGKQTLWEFALGGISPGSLGRPARNPWGPGLDPGGSSSGSAAAVAAGLCTAALGSDTGGSIRHPAAWCGLAGFKPSYDLIDRRGVFPLAPTLDHVGLLARSAEDCGLLLEAATGGAFRWVRRETLKGLRLGLATNFLEGDLAPEPETLAALHEAVGVLRDLGCEIVEARIPEPEGFSDVGMLISRSEGHAVHQATLQSSPGLYGHAARIRLTVGGAIRAADYLNAQRWRTKLAAALAEATGGCDALLLPSVPRPAFALAEEVGPVARAFMMYTRLFNLTGAPALALPTGFSADGLPLSMQLAASGGQDLLVLQIGAAFERAAAIPRRRPPGFAPQ